MPDTPPVHPFSDLALSRRLERTEAAANAAFVEARLRFAAERGCDLAMMGALPGSASQRNAERQGFRIAYTRTKWRLCAGSPGAARLDP
jgi:hypothetical protein